jgi:HAD superfamily hydrolase (TIGR01484 family)
VADGGRPAPVRRIPEALCRSLDWFCTDLDDTLSTDGLIPATSYEALWALSRAGIRTVVVTGRPAGWCDHIARMWPVAGVVGENGAFSFSYDRSRKSMNRRYSRPPEEMAADRQELARICARVLREVPGAGIAADQSYRISDFAIDFREDVPPLGEPEIRRICRILDEEGVRYKVSSIHVNFWRGDFDKLSCLTAFIGEQTGRPFAETRDSVVFIGDSPNDEPLFAGIPLTISVANIRRFLGAMTHLPFYITEAECAEGFREAVDIVLSRRMGGSS